jgi:hypothetical protein
MRRERPGIEGRERVVDGLEQRSGSAASGDEARSAAIGAARL